MQSQRIPGHGLGSTPSEAGRFVPLGRIDGLGAFSVAPVKPETFLRDSGSREMSQLRKAIVRRDPCAYCGCRVGGTIDHVVPRARGGENRWSNVAGACWPCNHDKGAVSLLEFLLGRCGMVGVAPAGEEMV